MRTVGVGFNAAADGVALTIDRDSVLSFVTGRASFVVSSDSAATIANTLTAPATGQQKNLIVGSQISGQIRTDFPVSSGEVIFVSSSAAGSINLHFTDPT